MTNWVFYKLPCIVLLMLFINVPSNGQEIMPRTLKEAEVQIRDLMEEGDIPGLSIVIIKGDQVINLNYGVANEDTKQPINSKTLFEIGSCTKAFTALAITQLEDQGKINLDDPVSKHIPWFKVTYRDSTIDISIRQLLYHTSGIPFKTISLIPPLSGENALEETVRKLVGQELDEIPGKEYQYATINYDVLALIIQAVTKQSFEEYLQKEILDRLALRNTTIGVPKKTDLMATGYKIGFFRAREYKAPVFRGNNAAGYVISNSEDLLIWMKYQMGQSNNPLSKLVQRTHQRDESVPLHNMAAYARGWEIILDGTGEISHGGLNPNFTSYICIRPKEKIGISVLANSNSAYTAFIGNKLMKLIAGEEIEKEYTPGDGGDKFYSGLSLAIGGYILMVLVLLTRIGIHVGIGKRKFERWTGRKFYELLKSIFLIIPFVAGILLLPQALVGFSWDSILVWIPISFYVLIGGVFAAMAVTYMTFIVGLSFPEENIYKRSFPRLLIISVLSGVSNVVIIIMVTSVIGTKFEIKYVVFYYALAIGLYLAGRRFVQVSLIKLTRDLVYDLRMRLIDKIFSSTYENFERIDRGRIYTTVNDDVNTIGQSTNLFVTLVTSVVTVIGAFVYLASISLWATMFTVFLIVTLSFIYYLAIQKTNRYFEEARDSQNVFMKLINGMIDGYKEISLHWKKKSEFKQDVSLSANEYREKITKADVKFANAFLIGESLLVILLGVVAIGMPEIFPNIRLNTVMSFVILLLYLIGPINGILNSIPALVNLKIAWKRVNQFILAIPGQQLEKSNRKCLEDKVYKLEVKGIEYEFENGKGEKENFRIGPIDLEISSGEIVFITGGNGSGKTTLAKVLTGLYAPSCGYMLINGKPVSNNELSEYFSAVFSPAHLFEKIYGTRLDDKQAVLRDYMMLLELESKVEINNGVYSTIKLSSGQRKRLALLQCYLEDSPIFLFDEWAADQDPHYRHLFYNKLLPEMKKLGKLVIAITHDDHYYHLADRVVKMNQGKLEVSVSSFQLNHA